MLHSLSEAIRLLKEGRHRQAEQLLRTVPKTNPQFPEVQYLLGVALLGSSNVNEALPLLKKATRTKPKNPDVWMNYGLALDRAGSIKSALDAFKKSVSLNSKHVPARYNLAVLAGRLGYVKLAKEQYQLILQIDPEHINALNNLGQLLCSQGEYKESIEILKRALMIQPSFIEARFNLAAALIRSLELDAGIKLLEDLRSEHPGFSPAIIMLAKAYANVDEPERARDLLDADFNPDQLQAELWNDRGLVQAELGLLEEAVVSYRQALQLDESNSWALYNLSLAGALKEKDKLLKQIENALPQLHRNTDKCLLLFAAGNVAEKTGDFKKSIQYFKKANRFRSGAYRAKDVVQSVDRSIEIFTQDFFRDRSDWGSDSKMPIFIVGMPRSGTTLVEQILSSHPKVYGAGELIFMEQLRDDLAVKHEIDAAYPDVVTQLTRCQISDLGREYLGHISSKSKGYPYVTDKLPGNFFNLGLIALLLPGAKVIHCSRNPMDTCLSCFTANFQGNQPFAYDFDDLAHYYQQYQRLMSHWEDVLPVPVLNVQYEALVESPEVEVKRLVAFCDLDWDVLCLQPHKNTRRVATASNYQVRQPINKRSIKRSDRFGHGVDELRLALATNGVGQSIDSE